VPVLVACDAEAGALGGPVVAAVSLVGQAPEVVEDLLVARDARASCSRFWRRQRFR